VATGTISCKLTGTATFSPPLQKGGASAETRTFSVQASDCTTSGSDVSYVAGGTITGTTHMATNKCVSGLTSVTGGVTATITWSPSSIQPTVATFSGSAIGTNGAGEAGFVLPNPGGTASVTGSFAGSDNGAATTASLYTTMTESQILSTCDASSGLSSLSFGGSGTLSS
jgi:hypothetical protein